MPEHQRIFELLAAKLPPDAFEVTSFQGREALSELFRFDVRLRTAVPELLELEGILLGGDVTLTIRGQFERNVTGIVTRVTKGEVDQRGLQHVSLRIRPKLWQLGRKKNCRIFQEKKVHEIVHELLDEWHVEHQLVLSREYEARTYCVQYHETDLAFIRRILAEEGLFFYFEAPPVPLAPALLVIGDAAIHYRPIAGATIEVRAPSGMNAPDDTIHELSTRRALKPGRALVKEFDWLRPSLNDSAAAEIEQSARDIEFDERAFEIYDHYDDYEPSEIGKEAADLHLEQHRRRAHVALGTSRSRRLHPGVVFPLAEEAELWAVVAVAHEGSRPASEGGSAGQDLYSNTFQCAPGDEAYRPRRPPRVLQQTLETAIVVGPEKEEIHTDRYGRIKVQFHWDREGKQDEKSSCWIRVMQAWAGSGWGFQFIPRVGMEVLVQFVGGDVDKPIVIGSVYNGAQPVPFPLTGNQTKSGIKTRSFQNPDGYNELSFEDQSGRERVHVHAQKDLDLHVRHARTAHVGASDATSVGGDSSLHVGGHETRVIARSLNETIGETVTKTYQSNVDVGIGGNAFLDAMGPVFVNALQSMTVTTTDALTTTVGSSYGLSVAAALTASVGTDARITVGGGLDVDVTGEAYVGVTGSLQLISGAEISIAAQSAIRLVCGNSVIEMSSDEISITSPSISIGASDELTAVGSSASLKLDGDAEMVGGTTTISGSGGSVVLDGNATLQGGSVKLKGGGGDSNSTDSSSDEDAPPPPKLSFSTYVGHGNESDTEVKLVIESKDGAELASMAAGAAVASGDGNVTWEVDPDAYSEPIRVVRVDEQGRRQVLAGPVDPKHMRAAMVDGDHERLARMIRRRTRPLGASGLVPSNGPRPRLGVEVPHEAGGGVGAAADDAHEDWSQGEGGES